MIARCGCRHPAQDKLHGEGCRVFNPCKVSVGGKPGMRCTVCGRVAARSEAIRGYAPREPQQKGQKKC